MILIALISIVFGTSITSCPYTINSNGTYYLANNLVSSGDCIIVNAQNVVIDGQGYSITSSGHGIFINVSSFNVSIVNVNISSNQNNIYREGSIENSTITIYNSTLNTWNYYNYNIYFYTNKSSNNTIRIVNSSMYANFSNIIPNDNLNGSVENLVLEIQNSTLNASNHHNIYFPTNTSSNNTIRIVNSSMYAQSLNILTSNYYYSSVENLVIEILNSTLNASGYNIYFYTNKSSNNTIRIVNSSMYADYINIVLNDNQNGLVENLVLEIVDSTFASNVENIYFYTNKSLNNTIKIINSSIYTRIINIAPNVHPDSSVENLVLEIINSTFTSNGDNIYFYTNKSLNNTIRIINSSMHAQDRNVWTSNDYYSSVENLVLEIVNSTLNASNDQNIYFSVNKSSNNTVRIVNSSLHANYSNIVPNDNLDDSLENLVIEILNSTLNSSNGDNIYFFTNKSSNNTIRIGNSSLYAWRDNIWTSNYYHYSSVENLVIEILNSTLNASIYNIDFYTNKSSNNTIRIVNSSLYAYYSNIIPNHNLNGFVENLVIEIIDSTLNSSNYRNIYFSINKSSNNTIRIVNSSMYALGHNILTSNYYYSSVEDSVIEILNSTLNASNYHNIYFFTNKSSNNTIRIVNSSMYADYRNIIPNDNLNGFVENLVIEIIDSTLNSSNGDNIYFFTNTSSNNTIRIGNSSMYAWNGNIWTSSDYYYHYHYVSVENLVIEILNSTLNTSIYNIYFYTNKSSNNTIRIVNSSMYADYINIVLNDNLNGFVENLVIEILNSTLNASNHHNIYFFTNTSSNNTIRIGNSSLYASNNFLLYSLNKTINNYNMLIVNTSLIGNISFNLTEVTLNISGFNNLFLSDQHFVNSSSNISGILNISKTLGTSIIGTPYLGGNYWKGYSDLCPDFDGDGLCELPYIISSNAIDYLPLTNHTQHGTVLSGNFSTNSISIFNISINVSPSINYTIYLYINGTLYNSTSGSGVGNYSLGATLGSGNYTYWFVVDYTIGGFNYSYTYGNYSAYIDIELPSISILWPIDGESYTRGNRIIQILVIDDLSSTLSCQLNVTGPDSFNHAFTISNGYVYNYSYNFNSLGLYTMNVSCNDGINQNQTFITFRIRESGGSGGDSNTNDTMNGSNSDLNQSNNTFNDTINGSSNNLNQSNNTLSDTMNNSNMNNTNQSIENNTTINNNDGNGMNESGNTNNQGQPSRSKTTSRTQQSDLDQSENQTIQQNESEIIQKQNILNQTEEEQKPSSEELVKNTEESKNVSQQDLISRINNYISIGLSEMIKLSSPFPYLLLGSIILLLFRTIKLKIIPLQDRVILQFNNILNMPIKNLKVNIDGQELVTDENGQIILSSMPKQIKPKLYIMIKL